MKRGEVAFSVVVVDNVVAGDEEDEESGGNIVEEVLISFEVPYIFEEVFGAVVG